MTGSAIALVAALLITGSLGTAPASAAVGDISTVAGTGLNGSGGDGGAATLATLRGPIDVAVGLNGDLFIADRENHRVRRVDDAGVITAFAGTGTSGFSGDDGPATAAELPFPQGLVVDADGNVFVAGDRRVRKIDVDGVITTIAGTGEYAGLGTNVGDGGPATEAELGYPVGMAFAADGSMLIADDLGNRVWRIDSDGIMTTFAGGGAPQDRLGDGGQATEALVISPNDVDVDASGNVYITENTQHHRIRRVAPDGVITTFAGIDGYFGGFQGDGGPATAAQFQRPSGIAIADDGTVFVADTLNSRVRRIDSQGTITTVAGTGERGFNGEGQPGATAMLDTPVGLTLDADGNLLIADQKSNRVRKLEAVGDVTGTTTTIDSGTTTTTIDSGTTTTTIDSGTTTTTIDSGTTTTTIDSGTTTTTIDEDKPRGLFQLLEEFLRELFAFLRQLFDRLFDW